MLLIQLSEREGVNLCMVCVFVHVGEMGQLLLHAGSNVVDGQMVRKKEDVLIMKK